MARSVAERRVYLACRAIFTRQTALVRKQKKIRELVEQHRTSFNPLVAELGVEGLVEVLKVLLEDRIFESDLRAKEEFPELFPASRARDIQRAESENHAVQSVAEALEEIESLHQNGDNLEEENEGDLSQTPMTETLNDMESLNGDRPGDQDDDQHEKRYLGFDGTVPVQPVSDDLPSLYPSRIPYVAQHIILTTTQHILEECCFDFVKRWQPSIVLNKGWDCAEAGELTKWTRIISKHSGKLPAHAFTLSEGSSLDFVLVSTNKLRHSAVHRLRLTARGVSQLVEAARNLAEALQDSLRTSQLKELQLDIDSKVKAMELYKNVLEDEFARQLEELSQQRKDLDEKEERLRADLRAKDLENTFLIGSLLEESVKRIFHEGAKPHHVLKGGSESTPARKDAKSNGWKQYLKLLVSPALTFLVPHVSFGAESPAV
ncbi:hypothetical protein DM02DRAFT_712176 [Periconia macrospinosa]|uniref:Uncharacterized protein n=1 Tax=Periconia macrospinosa TaxID=97972 RepID=A0A2V1CY93_9PLEO|nr:hypothetical protein DM02DRAFT_712176 [Periconia macrospinosa]